MKVVDIAGIVFDRILDFMVFLAGFILIFVTTIVCVEITTRYFMNYPMGWVIEIASYALLYITFLVAAWVLREEGHVGMDFVIAMLGPRAKSFTNAMTSVVSALICVVLTWSGVRVTWDLYKTGYFTPTMLELPKAPLIAIIAIGSFLLVIQFIRRSRGFLLNLARRKEKAESNQVDEPV